MTNISINLMGGLGNQLFQIFTTLAYGLENNKQVIFPYSRFVMTGKVRRTYWCNFLKYLKSYTTEDVLEYIEYHEPAFLYSALPYFEENTLLSGYFQSDKYFSCRYQEIINIIQLRKQQASIKQQYINLFGDHNISLHFRIDDYKDISYKYPILNYEYYENALSDILKFRNNKLRGLCFFQVEDSETVEIMISRLSQRFDQIEFQKVSESIPDWKALLIMSCCQDHIIANSTYSWWAAYFNESPNKIVYHPAKWFGPVLDHNTSTLFPDSWKQISH